MKNTIIEDDPVTLDRIIELTFSDDEIIQVTEKQYAELVIHCTKGLCKNCIKNLPLSSDARKPKSAKD
jgi:ferredoxin